MPWQSLSKRWREIGPQHPRRKLIQKNWEKIRPGAELAITGEYLYNGVIGGKYRYKFRNDPKESYYVPLLNAGEVIRQRQPEKH
jgi:hypothetical protein